MQVSLLRLIGQHKFQRLGGTRAISSNARIIAATNTRIDELVPEEGFRVPETSQGYRRTSEYADA